MCKDTAATPAIPLETLISLLTEHRFDPQAAQILERDGNCQRLRFRCHQILYVHDFMDSRLQDPTSISVLAAGFGYDRDRVQKALAHGLEPPETRGRYLAMSNDAEREISSWIQTNAAKNKTATPRDLREHIMTNSKPPRHAGMG
jgi:hypothetical protein